jgi:hypothetical protein
VSQYCHFHPISPSKWHCTKCSRFYDNACVPNANEKLQHGQCPFCQSSLNYLSTENSTRSERYLLKQLIKDCLTTTHIYLLIISIGIAAISTLLDISTVLKYLICFTGVLFINLHFSRNVTYFRHELQLTGRRNSLSRNKHKPSAEDMFSPKTSIQLTLVAGLLLLFPIYYFYSLHWFIGLLLILIGGSTFPFLNIFSLHTSENDQGITISMLFKELKPYALKLSLQSFSLFWITLLVSDLALSLAPLLIAITMSAALSTLTLFIILNYSTRIFMLSVRKLSVQNIHKQNMQEKKLQAPKGPGTIYNHDKISTFDTDIDLALKTGQYLKVVSLLEEALKRNGSSNLRRQQFFLVLCELKDHEKLSRYAGLFLHWMLERNKIKDASQLIYQLRKNDPTFLIYDLELINSLAKHFFRAKKYALTVWLAEDAKTRFQACENLAELYLSAAQAMITHYKDLEKAEEYLLFIFKSCSEYPSAEAAKALLFHLQHNQKKQQDLRY